MQTARSSPATGRPFTHILKPAGTGGFDTLPVVEWLALALGAAAGFEVPAMALVAMPDSMPPALLVERFDIRRGGNDTRLLALEDMCSVLGLADRGQIRRHDGARRPRLRPLSTAPEDGPPHRLKRALFAWLIADGDMHLKNMALLKIAEPGDRQFRSVRMAPLYDAVTTRVFPRLKHDRMALKLNGKDDRLRRADFKALAAIAGIQAADADQAIDAMAVALLKALDALTPPPLVADMAAADAAAKMRHLTRERIDGLT